MIRHLHPNFAAVKKNLIACHKMMLVLLFAAMEPGYFIFGPSMYLLNQPPAEALESMLLLSHGLVRQPVLIVKNRQVWHPKRLLRDVTSEVGYWVPSSSLGGRNRHC